MRTRPALWLPIVALAAQAGCFEHHNELGSIDVGGGPINVGGAAGSGSDGRGGNVNALIARCNGSAETLSLSRVCTSASDCCAVRDSSDVSLLGAPSSACTTGVLAIRCGEQARLSQFVELCPMAVGGCSPSQLRIATEDGKSAAYTQTPSARCDVGVCRSYLP